LKSLKDNSVDGVLFDPPYSVEQCLRRYTPKHGGTAGRAEYWARCKDEISRVIEPNGLAVSFCWDSTGIGKSRGFEIVEIMLLCHGACHNDTIITIDKKHA
jgi:DNA modification methylase